MYRKKIRIVRFKGLREDILWMVAWCHGGGPMRTWTKNNLKGTKRHFDN